MQNFTLGKKGYTMLLLALVLLIGSSPTFGQTNCPTVSDTTQDYCYLKTVADLQATANGDSVKWYRNTTSNTAIPSNELLQDGTYYAGNNSGTCTSRVAVTVSVDDIGAPTADFGNTYAPCEYSPGGTSTVQDLIASVNGNSVEIYDQEYSGSPLAPATPLNEGSSYFAGQRNPTTNCPSSRLSLRYDPVLALAPDAVSPQTFCPGATVADLVATSTNPNFQAIRWYSTATSNPQLSDNTPLINGESYYASQIVNRQGSALPPCESRDRAEVIVNFQVVTPDETTQVFCVDSEDPSTTPKVEDLVSPYGTPFFADANFTQLLDSQTVLIDDEDYFTANGEDASCEATRVIVDFIEIPNAGEDVNETVCQTELDNPAALIARFNALLVGRDIPGTFTDSNLTELGSQFLINPIGVFTTTYTVDNGSCTDSADITVTVIAPTPVEAGTISNQELCENETLDLYTLLSSDANTDGTFTDSDDVIIADGIFNPMGRGGESETITYTVNGESAFCTIGTDEEMFDISILVAPDAGENGSVEVSRDDAPFNLFSELEGKPESGGTWSPGNADGSFNPATGEEGTYTYTVTNGVCEDQAIVNVIILDENLCPVVPRTEQSFCRVITDPTVPGGRRRPRISDLQPAGATWYDSRVETDPERPNAVLKKDHVYYAGNAQGTCDNRTRIIVRLLDDPSAGVNSTVEVCRTEGSVDIVPRISPDLLSGPADANGTFSPAFASGTTMFNPLVDSPGTYTYTVTSANSLCSDVSSEITINIQEPQVADAGSIQGFEVCSNDDAILLSSILNPSNNPILTGRFTNSNDEVITNFNPSTATLGDNILTYTVDDSSFCVIGTDSVDFTIKVLQAPNSGESTSIPFCITDINDIVENQDDFLELFNAFIADADGTGTFNPDLTTLANQFLANSIGTFETTYTVSNDDCSSSSTFSIVVSDTEEANAGTIGSFEICVNEDAFALSTLLIGGNSTLGGIFTNSANVEIENFDPSTADLGDNTITYTVDSSSACVTGEDFTTFTITVNEINDANAGGPVERTYCVGQDEEIDLRTILGDGAIPFGSFSTPFENGLFNPSEAGVNEFNIIYTVNGADDCAIGTDTATIKIIVTDLPDAPVAETPQSFCLIDNPTVGDITITEDNVVIYLDAALTEVADATTALTSGMNYYAVSTNDSGTCSSEATEITVTITDPSAPSLQIEGNEFCRSDDPRVQDLINNFTEPGVLIYTSSTGGTLVSASTDLQNGVTYYGASIDGTSGCESTERLAVVAKVEFCGIPEGFSPNGDGINDRFVIPDIAENFPNYTIEIFNRWGNVVFKGNASTPDWDGISNQSGTLGNDVLPVGVYFYILNYNDGQTSPVQGKLYLSI